jgi:hypothetical protein
MSECKVVHTHVKDINMWTSDDDNADRYNKILADLIVKDANYLARCASMSVGGEDGSWVPAWTVEFSKLVEKAGVLYREWLALKNFRGADE